MDRHTDGWKIGGLYRTLLKQGLVDFNARFNVNFAGIDVNFQTVTVT